MHKEIEHKYLVDRERWKQVLPAASARITQGYLVREPGKTVRVRLKGEKAYLTIKGPAQGASRDEFEYALPTSEAEELLRLFCPQRIEKTRYYVEVEGCRWEVDVFEGLNTGLVVAEIELTSEDQQYIRPDWVTEDVTADPRYSNAALAERPFTSW